MEDPAKKKQNLLLSTQALTHYENSKFSDTKSSLNSLSSQVTNVKDLIAFEHNTIVTTFSASPCSDATVRDTLRNLQRVRQRAVEHRAGKSSVAAGHVNEDGTSNPTEGTKTNTNSNNNNNNNNNNNTSSTTTTTAATTGAAASASATSTTSPDSIDPEMAADPQLSTMLFNEAALCCSLGKFRSALSRLDALFQNVMLLDDWLAVRTCYLLLDVYIHVHRGLDANSEALKHLDSCGAKVLEALEQRTTPNENGEEQTSSGSNSGEPTEPSSLKSIPDLKFHLKLYRAKLQLISSNATNAKKEIKAALDIYNKDIKNDKTGTSAVSKRGTTPALFLKANLEYVRENFKKAVKLLNAALSNKTLEESTYMNNMGCINFQSQRYSVSSLYFSRALTLIDTEVNNVSTGINRSEVLYNIGLQMLLCGKDVGTAFQCFHQSSTELHMRPRVWMRMAECCVAENERLLAHHKEKRMKNGMRTQHSVIEYKKKNIEYFQNDMVASIINGGRVMLPVDPVVRAGKRGLGIPTRLIEAGDEPTMSMSYAIMCLRNVLYLTATGTSSSSKDSKTSASDNKTETKASAKETKTKTTTAALEETVAVRHAALTSLAYCSLCQSHPVVALDYSMRLLSSLPKCNATQQYLCHTYAAEALCTMNRCSEALVQMNAAIALSKDATVSTTTPSKSTKTTTTIASTPTSTTARALLLVNLASIRLQQNELDLAEKSLRQALLLDPASSDALRGMVYLRLRQGQSKSAMQLLQERRPPSAV